MDNYLFSIQCVTCRRKLAVCDEAVIGQIVTCAKCGSMVQVVPPPGWLPPPKAPVSSAEFAPEVATSGIQKNCDAEAVPAAAVVVSAASLPGPPPVAISPPQGALATGQATAGYHPLALLGIPLKLASLAAIATVMAAGVVVWILTTGFSHRESGVESPNEVAAPSPVLPAGPAPVAEAPPDRLDRRWLPDATRLAFSLRVSTLAELGEQAEFRRVIQAAEPVWQPSMGRVLSEMKLVPRGIRRLTWAAVDPRAWSDAAVAVIELEPGQDASGLCHMGTAVDLQIQGNACRCLAGSAWPHPFAVLDERTILTGRLDLLRHLAERSEAKIASPPMDRLLATVTADAEFVLLADLVALREPNSPFPAALGDVWPAGRGAWHVLCESPQGIGMVARANGRSEIALACDNETTALKVQAALGQIRPAARAALDGVEKSITRKLEAGRMTAAEADQYDALVKHAISALGTTKVELADPVVWLRTDWAGHLPAASAAALDSQRPLRTDWLSAVLAADEANHHRLLNSIGGYVKAKEEFPAGAGGGTLLPPQTRLSWIASMLPYFGHADWHRELKFPYAWNSPQNRGVTQRPLETVVNPALGPGTTDAGFPVTHYVGVAGVGADAAELKAGDRRAGLFGYSRTPRIEDITDGASNTLATLGVSDGLGPWAAGGSATVRALTKRPYVNGPDGFGSGQPDGMVAGMADGSVRFVSKNVDPVVLEQLATIHGGEPQTAAALAPVPAETAVASAPGTGLPDAAMPSRPAIAAAPKTPATAKRGPKAAAEPPAAKTEGEGREPASPGPEESETPPPVDLAARLADRVPEIHFPGTALLEAVRLTSRMSTVPVSFDFDWMQVLGAQLRDPVTVRLTGATTGEIFQAIVSPRGLTCETSGAQLLVTAPLKRREAQRAAKLDVADLTGKDPAAGAELVDRIVKLVAPESWRPAGGQGAVEYVDGHLVVAQTELGHYLVRNFCDRVRVARGKSPAAGEKVSLATHLDLARPRLNQLVSANFPEPTPLAEITAELERLGQATIVFDGVTMAAAGLSPQRPSTLSVHERPLYEALMSALQPLGLTYRIVDAGTLEVTTRKAASARLEVEFYPVAAILAKGVTPEALVEQLKAQLAGATWNDAGGPGVLLFDKAAKCLIVLQSQPIQARLQILLGKL